MKKYSAKFYVKNKKNTALVIAEQEIKAISKDMARQVLLPNKSKHLISMYDEDSGWGYYAELRVFIEEIDDETRK